MSPTLKSLCASLGKVIVGMALLFALLSGAARAATAPEAERPPLPDDLRYEFKDVPADENAILLWRRAGALATAVTSQQQQTLTFCWTPGAKEPSAEGLSELQALFKKNREALELFNDSLNKPKAQWPERNPQNPEPELTTLFRMIHLRLFEADQLAEQGRFEEAVKSLEDSLKLAQMGVDGDASFLQYTISSRERTKTQDAILRLAARKQLPLPLLERLLNNLPSINDTETNRYVNMLKVERTIDYHAHVDWKKVAADWSRDLQTNGLAQFFPEDCIRPAKILLDPSLVAIHPKPFDLFAETEKSIWRNRVYRTNALSAWADRSDAVEMEYEEAKASLLHDIAPLMELLAKEPLPLNRQAVGKAREAYLKIKNPIGRIFDCDITGFMESDRKVFCNRTEREATRAVLALLIFERKKGVLPEKLSDLVDAGILKTVPNDPFSGQPLLYSRERRIVWSVGTDGADDDGEAGKTRWTCDDAVWSVPQLN